MNYSNKKLFTSLIGLTIISVTSLSFLLNKSLAVTQTSQEFREQTNKAFLSVEGQETKETNHLELADSRIQVSRDVYDVWQLTNQVRAQHGLRPLSFNQRLYAAAQNHSNDMARHGFMSHQGSNGSSMSDRVRAVGYNYSSIAENVAAGYRTPEEVVRGWMNSPGHRKNILNPNLTEIGVGHDNNYWTQVFGTPR